MLPVEPLLAISAGAHRSPQRCRQSDGRDVYVTCSLHDDLDSSSQPLVKSALSLDDLGGQPAAAIDKCRMCACLQKRA